jgi:lipoprotein|nr:DUF4097 family beta strand repeat-containing protein [uncultured Stomatobaculum sp.]
MKKRVCVLLAALGGSVMLLGACSSVVERFSRPESTAESRVSETSTEAELRASGSNASGAAEESSEESGVAESEGAVTAEESAVEGETNAAGETLAEGESSAEGESLAAAEGETETAAETAASESTAAETQAVAVNRGTLTRSFRSLTVEGDSLSLELSESIDRNFHLDYDGTTPLQLEDRENETLYVKETGAEGKVLRIAVPRGTALGRLNIQLGAGNLSLSGVSAESLTANLSLGDATLQNVSTERALLTLSAGSLRADALRTSEFKADAELSNLNVTLAEPLADFDILARTELGSVYLNGAAGGTKLLQRANSGKRLLLRSELGEITINGLQ